MIRSIIALVACCIALPVALGATPARPSVLSFWNAVFPERKLVPAGSGWRMTGGPAWPDGPTIAGKGGILVDSLNGFLSCSFTADPLEYAVTAALFITRSDAAFLLTSSTVDGPEGSSSSLQTHRWQNGQISEVSNLVPRITLADFVDESWLASHPDDRKTVLSAGRLAWDLPRYGTTIVIRPTILARADDANVGDDRADVAKALGIMSAHRKYSALRLAWDVASGTFALAGKDLR